MWLSELIRRLRIFEKTAEDERDYLFRSAFRSCNLLGEEAAVWGRYEG